MLGGFGAKKDATSGKRVVNWTKLYLNDESADAQVMATEIQCNEPDCVPIETLIVIVGTMSKSRWTGKVLKPIAEVEESDVADLDFGEFAKAPQTPALTGVTVVPMVPDTPTAPSSDEGEGGSQSLPAPAVTVVPMVPDRTVSDVASQSEPQPAPAPAATDVPVLPTSGGSSDGDGGRTDSAPASVFQPNTVMFGGRPVVRRRPAPLINRTAPRRSSNTSGAPQPRHQKGIRARGCPCCDPDNIDNIIDVMMSSNL